MNEKIFNEIKENEKNYYFGKLICSGRNNILKTYSKVQFRKRKQSNNTKFISDTQTGCIIDLETGEMIDSVARLQEVCSNETELFYNKLKLDYSQKSELQRFLTNKKRSLSRSRESILSLINTNIDYDNLQGLKFLTLTFKENITDPKKANSYFKEFVKKLNNAFSVSLKYIAMLENQERGAIHYHVIIFNAPYMPHTKLVKLWTKGSVNIQSLLFRKQYSYNNTTKKWTQLKTTSQSIGVTCDNGDVKIGTESIKNVGAYITKSINYTIKDINKALNDISTLTTDVEIQKYIDSSKNQLIFTKNVKLFNVSKNLEQPTELYLSDMTKVDELTKVLKVIYFDCDYTEFNTYKIEYEDPEYQKYFGEIEIFNFYGNFLNSNRTNFLLN